MLRKLRTIQAAEHLKAVKTSTLSIYTHSEKYFNKQPLKKKNYSRKIIKKKVVTSSGAFMGQSLLGVMNVIKAHYHVSKEFAQVLFTPSLFCTM